MVEYSLNLDHVFNSLADPTRRDILRRVSHQEMSISEVAQPYDLTFAAISKHLQILEQAKLIVKRRAGRQRLVHLSPAALQDATDYLQFYRTTMNERLNSLDDYLNKE